MKPVTAGGSGLALRLVMEIRNNQREPDYVSIYNSSAAILLNRELGSLSNLEGPSEKYIGAINAARI
jgi:hypothetical protein